MTCPNCAAAEARATALASALAAAEGERDALRRRVRVAEGANERLGRRVSEKDADRLAEHARANLAESALAEAQGREKALRAALLALLVWAKWIKRKVHRHPNMDEPNTGAIVAAEDYLASNPKAALALPYSPQGRPTKELQGAAAQQLSDLADALAEAVRRVSQENVSDWWVLWTDRARAALRAAGRLGGEK